MSAMRPNGSENDPLSGLGALGVLAAIRGRAIRTAWVMRALGHILGRVQVPASTERLQFRAWRDDDVPLALAIWGDPAVSALVGGPFDERAVRERLAAE